MFGDTTGLRDKLKAAVEQATKSPEIRLSNVGVTIPRAPLFVPYIHKSEPGANSTLPIATTEHKVDRYSVFEFAYAATDNPHLQKFLAAAADMLAAHDIINVDVPDPMSAIEARVNTFLNKQGKGDYRTFTEGIKYHELQDNDFGTLVKDGLKRRLFEFRAKTYLGALAAAEDNGADLGTLLDTISDSRIPPIKNDVHETAFDYIKANLL